MSINNGGKPPSIKSRQAGIEQLLLLVTDAILGQVLTPQTRVKLLSAKAMVHGASVSQRRSSGRSEASGSESREASDGEA